MDPQATLEKIREAYGEDRLHDVKEGVNDLLNWIREGGFIPALTEPQLSCLLLMADCYPHARKAFLEKNGVECDWN